MLDFNISGSIVEFFLNPSGYFVGIFEPYYAFLPALILLMGALVMLCFPENFQFTVLVAFLSAAAALILAVVADVTIERSFFNQMLAWTQRISVAQVFILFTLLLSMLVIYPLVQRHRKLAAEYFSLMFFSAMGGIQMSMSRHMIALFLGIELLSLPLYVLCALRKHDNRSREAGFKYFMIGAFAAGFFLMGSAYLYGASGSFVFRDIVASDGQAFFFLIGGCFLFVALAFKVALFPFHSWLPDVYEGAPAAVTAFMSSAVKMAIFVLLVTLVYESRLYASGPWLLPMKLFIIISMTLTNLAAMRQKSFKRMLAYSSIAHVAYTLIALVASTGTSGNFAAQAVLFYVVVYGIASLGTFAVISYLDSDERAPFYYEKLSGLAKVHPFVALANAVFLLSLAGIPPVAGFIGKFYLFSAAVDSGYWDLAIAGIINSLISIYYYARPVVMMYMHPPSDLAVAGERHRQGSPTILVVLMITFGLTVLIGVAPSILFHFIGRM